MKRFLAVSHLVNELCQHKGDCVCDSLEVLWAGVLDKEKLFLIAPVLRSKVSFLFYKTSYYV